MISKWLPRHSKTSPGTSSPQTFSGAPGGRSVTQPAMPYFSSPLVSHSLPVPQTVWHSSKKRGKRNAISAVSAGTYTTASGNACHSLQCSSWMWVCKIISGFSTECPIKGISTSGQSISNDLPFSTMRYPLLDETTIRKPGIPHSLICV